jgi:hypothetical protein
MPRPISKLCLAAACAASLAACAPALPPSATGGTAVPDGFPAAWYRQAEAAGRSILHVDPARSLVLVEVRRGGPFARFGHDHIVASHDVSGYVDPAAGRTDLFVPLDRLEVDEQTYRDQTGLDTRPTQDDIDGTRRNMLVRVLEAELHPFAMIHAEFTDAKRTTLRTEITLHGVTRAFDIPVRIEANEAGMTVSGQLAFNQTAFGMVPMSVLGGAIQVEDRLVLRFRIHAASPAPSRAG